MAVVESSKRNKFLYKIELGLLKIIPMLIAFMCLLNSVLSYFDIDTCILSYLGGTSIITLVFLYVSSYVFKFCKYHRMFLHYIVVTQIINIYDYYYGIPIDNLEYLCLHLIIAGLFLFIILYLYVKINKGVITKNN